MTQQGASMSKDATTAVAETAVGTPAELLKLAVEGNADVEKLEKLMDLQERWEANQARKAFFDALAQFQTVCPDVERTDKAHSNKYAKLERIIAAIKEPLRDCGLTHRYEMANEDGELAVTCIVTHTAGHSERSTMRAPYDTSGSKNAVQARSSTMTYLQRYTLCGALGIVTVDEDNDGGKPVDVVSKEQAKELRELVKVSKTDEAQFFAYGGCDDYSGFPAAKFAAAVKRLNAKIDEGLS